MNTQELIQVVFGIGIPFLGRLIWACPNLILKENIRSFQKYKYHKNLIKYYIIQKMFC